ncbi:hypothetical protein [Desulfotignum phosphitoxidans]|uniref:Uncharacterized protein n=1 Tax=Desulfotignum phosphitoxidans DSM 13687 TaxID=1286635 RepID=S0G575_9BACT|nr:hypothetical protein [Desulfotignum phosphitoxidans]EMS79216.1 hypothetical protein Dpo_5c01390 [Desulfotignum phosphitoxidans DSM 13687]
MAKPNVTWLANVTSNDGANTGNATGGVGDASSDWLVLDLVNDKIYFLDSQQTDGDDPAAVVYPAIIPDSGDLEVPKTFISDASAGILEQILLAGTTAGGQNGGATRYVFAVYFDGPTAGIPYLEAWDDANHTTAYSKFLGGNGVDTETPANSTLKAIATTNAAPGSATWAGTALAKTTNRIELDTAALAVAKNLYFNIKQVIPSTFSPAEDSPVLSLRYLYS